MTARYPLVLNGTQVQELQSSDSLAIATSLSVTGNITGGNLSVGTVSSNLTPIANITYSLGNTTNRWTDLWLSNSTLYIGEVAVGASSGTLTIDGANVITSNTSGALSATGTITGGNLLTSGNVSATGNAFVNGYMSVTGNLYVANLVSQGNLTVTDPLLYLTATSTYPYNYDIGFYSGFTGGAGNTYQHTGFVRDEADGVWKLFSNVPEPEGSVIDLANAIWDPMQTGNITSGNIAITGIVSATGNITGSYIIVNGSQLTGLPAGYSNVEAASFLAAFGSNTVSTTGNITAGYFIGDGSLLTGLPAGYSNTNAASFLASFGSNTISTTGTITSGNVTGGNILTGGLISSTGNITGGNLSVTTGTVTVGNIVNGNGNGVGNIGSSTTYFNTVFAKATSAQYADLAEMYCADTKYAPGTVLDFGGSEEVTATTQSHSTRVAGIVSTHPSYLMNSALDCVNAVEVALVGRVPCRVVGTIRKGDRLVASSIAGVATALDMSKYEPGCIIGKALEDYDSVADGIIEVAVGRF